MASNWYLPILLPLHIYLNLFFTNPFIINILYHITNTNNITNTMILFSLLNDTLIIQTFLNDSIIGNMDFLRWSSYNQPKTIMTIHQISNMIIQLTDSHRMVDSHFNNPTIFQPQLYSTTALTFDQLILLHLTIIVDHLIIILHINSFSTECYIFWWSR